MKKVVNFTWQPFLLNSDSELRTCDLLFIAKVSFNQYNFKLKETTMLCMFVFSLTIKPGATSL